MLWIESFYQIVVCSPKRFQIIHSENVYCLNKLGFTHAVMRMPMQRERICVKRLNLGQLLLAVLNAMPYEGHVLME